MKKIKAQISLEFLISFSIYLALLSLLVASYASLANQEKNYSMAVSEKRHILSLAQFYTQSSLAGFQMQLPLNTSITNSTLLFGKSSEKIIIVDPYAHNSE